MKSSIFITKWKQTASFRIAGWLLTIAPLWLMLVAALTSAHAQRYEVLDNFASLNGGASDRGVLFWRTPTGTFSVLHDFDWNSGATSAASFNRIPAAFSAVPNTYLTAIVLSEATAVIPDGTLDSNRPFLNQSADLYLRVNAPTSFRNGQLLTYAFPVWNLGPGNADHEVLTTQVPWPFVFDYIRISGTPGLGTCTHPPYGGTGQIVCHENSSMAPNTTWTVRLTVQVQAGIIIIPGSGIIESATVTADTPDPNLANNTATVTTIVVR